MSIKALNWVLEDTTITDTNIRFVFLILANYADEEMGCYPSRENIAKKTGLSVRSVQRALNWLTDNNYITSEKRFFNGKQSTNLYGILLGTRGDSQSLGGSLQSDSHDNFRVTDSHTDTKDLNTKEYIVDVFNFWKSTMHLNGSTLLTKEREAKIKARLNEGYTVDRIKAAIVGCSVSPHHMGQNEQKTVYNDIELICRTGAKLEGFEQKYVATTPIQGGCEICRNHPNRKLVSLKTYGWIFNTETRQLEDCICKNGTA